MNGGKDIKIGDDKRPISIVPSTEEFLYNIANGELLTDEFGNPLITEVDTYFLPDATKKRSTSVVFNDTNAPYNRTEYSQLGIVTATYGDFDVYVATGVGTTGGGTVGFGSTVALYGGGFISLEEYPYLEVRTITDQGSEKNKIYFDDSVGITTILGVSSGDKVEGKDIPDGTYASKVLYNSTIVLSNNTTNTGLQTSVVEILRSSYIKKRSDVVWKIEEQFRESSEVSTTLLGVNRAETQLSLFSNVSSYGLDKDEFEFYSFNGGSSFGSWENRENEIYGNRYRATRTEETQESAIKLTAFPAPYSFPFGPKFERIGLYNDELFQRYLLFVQLGNDLHDYFNTGAGSSYPEDWKQRFLPSGSVYVDSGDVVYAEGTTVSFRKIDTWTDTWRDIKDSILTDPVTGLKFDFPKVQKILSNNAYDATSTRPGYSDSQQRYAYLQSRRVFRYQPGRISGFTFGLRSSVEPTNGIILEWGITNPTDQYVFKIEAGQFSIVRRSTIPLERSVLERSGLTLLDQVRTTSGDPFDDQEYWTIDIPRDKFNGDPLNANGPSGYLLQPEKVSMYKIEFGWYGAIGARFYAYIPVGNGEARWVVIHTLVIENSLGSPCLEDSYFRFKYSLNIRNTGDVRTPQYLYKYGASYYIDGGDEGTSQIYSVSSRQKTITSTSIKSLLGIRPKDFILNRDAVEIQNKKLIIPETLNVSTDSLTEVKVVTCSACPGFGHVYTPGVATTENGRYVEAEFLDANTITTIGDNYFYESDVGAKLIAPSIYNAYITDVSDPVGTAGSFETATIKGYGGTYGFNLVSRDIGGSTVLDRVTGLTTTIGIGSTYPHQIRISNYDAYAASDFRFTGSKIEIQFVNSDNRDDYAHWADFLIGVTDSEPDVSLPDTLNGFIVGGATTTILPNSKILFGEHTHSYAALSEDGVETTESWGPLQPPRRMAIDYRIPSLSSPAGGICSKATIDVLDPLRIGNVNQFDGTNPQTGVADGNVYIQVTGNFPNIEYDGGQVAVLDTSTTPETINITNSRFVGVTSSYISGDETFSYIQLSQTLGSVGSDFTILFRPVQITSTGLINKSKIYNYNPFPLYLVAKLKDNAAINNISVKETIGDFQRTITPKWYVSSNATVDNVGGKADTTGAAPTNFEEIDRLSSALIDVQNDQQLRPYTERDTLYIGANSTDSINMRKVFGPDRNVVTPDNNNIDATFILAKKIDGGGTGTVETSLNWKEQ